MWAVLLVTVLALAVCGVYTQECRTTDLGTEYRGNASTTVTGLTCQRWDKQTPHSHYQWFEDEADHENYCRNPDGSAGGVWCYTTDNETRWGWCDVPECEDMECSRLDLGTEYRGKTAVTGSGLTCQRWDVQTPHPHNTTGLFEDGASAHENYCRNPDRKYRGPWCFTTDPNIPIGFCNLPDCSNTDCRISLGPEYRGTLDKTVSGRTCQRWDKQSPHAHSYAGWFIEGASEHENYCRNPDSWFDGPWCYTTDNDTRWELCDVPYCNETECLTLDYGTAYRGLTAVTDKGITCQPWNELSILSDKHIPGGLSSNANYCRNPANRPGGPFCFTDVEYYTLGLCDVPTCDGDYTFTL